MKLPKNIVVIGLGSVSRCALPMLFQHLPVDPSAYTVLDFVDPAEDASWVKEQGAQFVQTKITRENYGQVLGTYAGRGDLIIDLAWNLGTIDLLEWCHSNDVRYVNASVEVWDPYAGLGTESPQARTLYARQMELQAMTERWGANTGPTAVLDHGANPGLVSHFVKAALHDIARTVRDQAEPSDELLSRLESAVQGGAYNELAQALGVKVIHISERDTQISSRPKEVNEFVNTWSVEGFYEEGIAPAEMGWGTHENQLPEGACEHDSGPKNQICLTRPGCRTWVRSWVPCGEIAGMVIRHGEAFSISDRLSVEVDGVVEYRPTVHYAYCPTDAAIASLHELQMRGYQLQPKQRIMDDDIVSGRDELGCLLMGHRLGAWWIGSLLDIEEARQLVPHQNATTVQVAAGVLAAVEYAIEEPNRGVCLPDDLPHQFVLDRALPYLGPFVSKRVDWNPLASRDRSLLASPTVDRADDDMWQFATFLIDDSAGD